MFGANHEITPKCLQMCPVSECIQREKQNLIHILETDSCTLQSRKRISNRCKMIKSYSRSAAGQNLAKSELLRPCSVLIETVNHLLRNVINDTRVSECTRYDFINDRLRSVKQDGVVQRLSGQQWLDILPPVIRFYAYSAFWLCEEPLKNFNPKLNKDQLLDCLLHILTNYDPDMYSEYAETYAEMEALYLINQFDVQTINRAVTLNLPQEVFQKNLNLTLKWFTKNYIAVFRKLLDLSLLQACFFVASHLIDVRKEVLQIMACAYNCKNSVYPLSKIKTNLLFNSIEEAIAECSFYGLQIDKDNDIIQFRKIKPIPEKVPVKKLQILQQKLNSIPVSNLLLINKSMSVTK